MCPLQRIPEVGPLDVESWEEQEANSFDKGQLITRTPSGWELATNADPLKEANGVVLSAEEIRFRFAPFGTIVHEPAHGRGTDAQFLWLGIDGGYFPGADFPTGPLVRVVQLVAKVIDVDHLLYFHRAWLA